MTHEEAIETIIRCRFQIRDSIELHIETLKHAERETAKALEALKQPQDPRTTRDEALKRVDVQFTRLLDDQLHGRIDGDEIEIESEFHTRLRKTTCVLRDLDSGAVVGVGRSWCADSDRYMGEIGKLIALYRALGREVPEWLLHIPQE